MFLDILHVLSTGKNWHVHIFITILKNVILLSLRISSLDSLSHRDERKSLYHLRFLTMCANKSTSVPAHVRKIHSACTEMHQDCWEDAKTQMAGPNPGVSNAVGLGWDWGLALLMMSQVMPVMLVGTCSNAQWPRATVPRRRWSALEEEGCYGTETRDAGAQPTMNTRDSLHDTD